VPTRKRETLRAVYDDDLHALLKSLGVYGDFAGGRLQCASCRDPVSTENLYAIYPDSGQVKVVCDKPDCVAQLVAARSSKA
jgi:hypothetical protein